MRTRSCLNFLSSVAPEMRAKLLFLFWPVWHHRNNIVHGDGKASVAASVGFLQNYLTSFAEANLKSGDAKGKGLLYPSQKGSSIPDGVKSNWQPPPVGSLKANVDAGWDSASRRTGIGVIVHDDRGYVVRSAWSYIPYCASVEEAEARACLEGLRHLDDLQILPGTVETDCLRVTQAVASKGLDRSPSWSIYLEIKDMLRSNPLLELKKVDRSSNHVAHHLAQFGKRESNGVLNESAPTRVLELITNDCKHFVL